VYADRHFMTLDYKRNAADQTTFLNILTDLDPQLHDPDA
jgi:hypothetical protein